MTNLMHISKSNIQFPYDRGYNRQREGIAMGSLTEPVLEDIFLALLERESQRTIIAGVDFYISYMVDMFIIYVCMRHPYEFRMLLTLDI